MRVKLVRSPKNPIIQPRPEMTWESGATFNPGAVKSGEIIHILYRAVNKRNISSFGHATTTDGETIQTDPWNLYSPQLTLGRNWVVKIHA